MTPITFRALTEGRHRTALVHDDVELTGDALDRAAEGVAERLAAAGVGPRARVAVVLGNTPRFIVSVLAVMKLDASAVLLNVRFTPREIADAIERTEAAAILADPDVASRGGPLLEAPGESVHVGTLDGPLALWRTRHSRAAAPSGELTVQFTSGVTGRSSIVPRTAANLADELENFAARMGMSQTAATVCPSPLFHTYGLVNGFLLPFFSGRPAILVDWFIPNEVVRLVRRYRACVLVGVPVMYKAIADAYGATAADLESLRICFSAGAPLSPDVFRAYQARYGTGIHQQYGTTETGVITVNLLEGEAGAIAAGWPVPGRQVDIVAEDGSPVPPGDTGEVVVRSRATAAGYIGQPELSARKFRDGRYFTGDVGRIGAGGAVVLSGRRTSFINVAGLKVDPAEVEQVLTTCDAVAECAVVPCRNGSSGETVKAVVVRRRDTSAKEIRYFCRQRLAAHKVPRTVAFVEALPRSATGKVLTKYLVDD